MDSYAGIVEQWVRRITDEYGARLAARGVPPGVRALDVLEGRVKLDGVKAPAEAPAPSHAGPIDMEKLAEALRPNGAAH